MAPGISLKSPIAPATPPGRAVRILIVDDSAVMRSLLRTVVASDPRMEVVETANDGASAIAAMESLHPDLILLDVEMPVMDGLSTLKQMKAKGSRVPVIMCSALTQRGAQVTIAALAAGAADYVAKPSGQSSREAATRGLASDLIPKILAITALPALPPAAHLPQSTPARNHVFPFACPASLSHSSPEVRDNRVLPPARPSQIGLAPLPGRALPEPVSAGVPTAGSSIPANFSPAVVVVGVSTGGPAALDILLPALPASFPLPVLLVQHMPELFTRMLAERLESRCRLRVTEAVAGEPIRSGTVYIAKGDWHFEVVAATQTRPEACIRLTQQPPENHCRPAVDVLFRSAVSVYGSRVLGVILTGMGSDGLAGCRLIRQQAGAVLVQDQATSAVWGMPGAVAQAGLSHRILPLNRMAQEILWLSRRSQREAFELRESAV